MNSLFKHYKICEDIEEIICKKIHQKYQTEINLQIKNIIGFNPNLILSYINVNEYYKTLNEYFVFRRKKNIYSNDDDNYNREIRIYGKDWRSSFSILSLIDYRNFPKSFATKNISLQSFNLKVLEKYFEKNMFFAELLYSIYYNKNSSIYDKHLSSTGEITNAIEYKITDYINDLNDKKKNEEYVNVLFKLNIINDDFIIYKFNNLSYYDMLNFNKHFNHYQNKILEFKLLYCDMNCRIENYNIREINKIVDLKYLYKNDLRLLMIDNQLTKWKRLTKQQLIKRLLEI